MDVHALVSLFFNVNELRSIPLQAQATEKKKKCRLKVERLH